MSDNAKKKEYMFLSWSVVSAILVAISATMYCFFDGALKTILLVTLCIFVAASVVLLSFAINAHFKHIKELKEETKDLK